MDDDAARERDETLRRADEVWERLRARLDERIARPLGDDGWTGKDVYAHFARWQQKSSDTLRTILAGKWIPASATEDENTLNDRWAAEDRALAAGEARARCLGTREELRGLVAGLDGKQWQRFGRLFEDITGPHYEHHLRAAGG